MLKPYDKEYMKMAMLRHEETFKQQELSKQDIADSFHIAGVRASPSLQGPEITNAEHKNSQPNRENQSERWDFYARSQTRLNQINDVKLEIEGEGEIQLTLGPSSYNRRKKADTPPNSGSGPSFSSSCSSSGTREEGLTGHRWGISMGNPESNSGLRIGRKNNFEVDEEDRLKHLDPWLFQPLSLNMT